MRIAHQVLSCQSGIQRRTQCFRHVPDGAPTVFDPTTSSRGWSIKCDTSETGVVDYVKYTMEDGKVKTHYSPPFFASGDNSGTYINKFDEISDNQCLGTISIQVGYFTWDGGDEFPCGSFTLQLKSSSCIPPAPESCARSRNMVLFQPPPLQSGWSLEAEDLQGNRRVLTGQTTAGVDFIPATRDDIYNYFVTFYRQNWKLRYITEDGVAGEFGLCTVNTPIGLDLDGSNKVERIEGEWQIDISGDGQFEILYEWFAPTEGILIDASIPIVHGSVTGQHLFGDMGGTFANGFVKLQRYDSNQNGVINGKELSQFAIWIDANSNAKVDANEVRGIAELGITSLITRHDEKYQSFAATSDGSLILMGDLWFAR